MTYYKELGTKLREHHKAIEEKVEVLKNEAPEDLDTFKEVAQAIENLQTSIDNLSSILETKANTDLANNLTTTVSGYALDARQGKVLNDNKLDKRMDIAYDSIDNITTNGFYVVSSPNPGLLINIYWDVNYQVQIVNWFDSKTINYRVKTGGVWSNWLDFANTSDLDNKYDVSQTIGGIATVAYSYTCGVTGFAIVTLRAWHTQTLPLDGAIYLNGEVISSNYFTYNYQSLAATIPVKVGDVISCTEGFNCSLRIIF